MSFRRAKRGEIFMLVSARFLIPAGIRNDTHFLAKTPHHIIFCTLIRWIDKNILFATSFNNFTIKHEGDFIGDTAALLDAVGNHDDGVALLQFV